MKAVYHEDGTFTLFHCNVDCIHAASGFFYNTGEMFKAEFVAGAGKIKKGCKVARKLMKLGKQYKPEKTQSLPAWENTVWAKG